MCSNVNENFELILSLPETPVQLVTIFVRIFTKVPFLGHGYYNKCLDEKKFGLEIVLEVWELKRWLVWTKD